MKETSSSIAFEDPADPVRTLAVIGAGDLGRAFALRCVQLGFRVVLEDVMPSRLRLAQRELALQTSPGWGDVHLATTVEDAVREADLAIDFVPDELESKLEIFSLLDRMAPPRTILCTPTQALSITDLASCTYRPAQCIALNSPTGDLTRDPLQVTTGRLTSAATLQRTLHFLSSLGLTPGVEQDTRAPTFTRDAPAS